MDIFDEGYSDRIKNDRTKEVDLFVQLADITFPRLKKIAIDGPEFKDRPALYPLLKPFLQPGLRQIRILEGTLHPEFFVAVKDRCRGLDAMQLKAPYCDVNSQGMPLLKSAFLDCIHHHHSLTAFNADRRVYDNLTCADALRAIASCPSLYNLDLPPLTVDLIPVIKSLDSNSFNKVRGLQVTAEEPCLEPLSVFIKMIEVLSITVLGEGDTVLRTCAKFNIFGDLSIDFENTDAAVVKGSDLIFLAEHCPGIQSLSIGEETADSLLKAIGITDETIRDMAKALPSLLVLTLCVDGASLTEQCLVSLGMHCPEISHIQIPANVCFGDLCGEIPFLIFPELDALILPQGAWQDSFEEEDVLELVSGFMELAPMLRCFLYGPADWFTDLMQETLTMRFEEIFGSMEYSVSLSRDLNDQSNGVSEV